MTFREKLTPPPLAPDLAPRILWTAGGIARRLGCSSDFVTSVLMKSPGCPIHRLGGRIYAVEPDLIEWMRCPNRQEPSETA